MCLGNDKNIENVCVTSVTIVNGKAACQNEVVFEDNFDTLSSEKWNHVVQIAGEPVSMHNVIIFIIFTIIDFKAIVLFNSYHVVYTQDIYFLIHYTKSRTVS